MPYLIKKCQLLDQPSLLDVRLAGSRIVQLGENLVQRQGERVIEAHSGLLLPGLHDHHIHLASLATSVNSIVCGPPSVANSDQLAQILDAATGGNKSDWLRGTAYHPSVAGNIDRLWLDKHCNACPVRIQHRGGRMWILNSVALDRLGILHKRAGIGAPNGVEYRGGIATGRLIDCDHWLRDTLGSTFPFLKSVSHLLASYGITGVTDCTPSNDDAVWSIFERATESGELKQNIRLMGSAALSNRDESKKMTRGEFKIHLLESRLPAFDVLCDTIEREHRGNRNVAVHCVSSTELLFALACLSDTGVLRGDRIEHAAVTPAKSVEQISELGLRVVSQPHFILERGEQYLKDVDYCEQPSLYRLRSFIDGGVPLAGGSDAPFGSVNPWLAMAAATTRKTNNGKEIGASEALRPEAALGLYTSCPEHPGVIQRRVGAHEPADLCLLNTSWEQTRTRLAATLVRATWIQGELAYYNGYPSSLNHSIN